MAKNQKSYTPEFKQQIVDLYNTGGTSYPKLEREYGVNRSTISGWVKQLSPIKVSRPLKNILFFNIEFLMHAKNPPVLNGLMDFFVIQIKISFISRDIFSYFSFISLMIRLRFTANIAIAPCICMLMRPDDDAVS